MRLTLLCAAAVLAAPSANASPLTYARALDLAARSAPSLKASALKIDAAKAEVGPAGALPDPKLTLGIDNFPVSGPLAGRSGADEMTMGRVGFAQEVPNARKRAARVERAEAGVAAASAEAALEARQVRTAAAIAWIEADYARRRLAAIDAILAQLEPLWSAAPSAVSSGRSRPAQALAVQTARATLEDRRAEVQAGEARARAQLARWTGENDPSTAGAPPPTELDPAALRTGLDQHPALAVRDAAVGEAYAGTRLAKAETSPDWGWEVAYQRRDPMFGDMVSAGVTISLPLWKHMRQAPMIAARTADLGRAQAQREDARRALRAQLDADLADHVMHHDQWLRARNRLVPLARQRADLETAAYGAGASGLSDVIDAFVGLADAQLTALDRETAVAIDAARLTLTYGTDQ
ncbi:TolC family protein [Caulobacter sp. BK020]|uniref:TolC family protein n=1 Tax=Caulobacter sp. BK020 TaxID=2512117 RepID=UPI001051CC1E|nr:TolC family protein [Caulobacter sp. BK020]TCS11903.1 outer membrane protein TolC [Caulobacter sp. BK020]